MCDGSFFFRRTWDRFSIHFETVDFDLSRWTPHLWHITFDIWPLNCNLLKFYLWRIIPSLWLLTFHLKSLTLDPWLFISELSPFSFIFDLWSITFDSQSITYKPLIFNRWPITLNSQPVTFNIIWPLVSQLSPLTHDFSQNDIIF